jgi:amidase
MLDPPGLGCLERRISQLNHDFARSAFVPHDISQPIPGFGAGPLAGLTVAVKDMYDVAGECTGGGSPAWLAAQVPARQHSGVVRRVLEAGATVVGKTICDEFFYSTVGANAHYGTPVNPRAPGRIPGGSSSGSAAATAAGACDLAIGSDTGGSVRVPAALCGIYGIRTTHGRFDFTGAMAMAPSFDAGGWFAATPGVFRRAGDVLLQGAGVPGRVDRVVVLDDALETSDAAIAGIVEETVTLAGSAIPTVERARAGGKELDTWREAMRIVQAYEVWQTFGAFLETRLSDVGPGVQDRMRAAREVTADQADAARATLSACTARLDELTPPGTVLALPTTAVIAPRVDETPEGLETYRVSGMRLSCMASISGLPQVTLPIGLLDGAPVGVSLLGWRGGDEALLDLALALGPLAGSVVRTTGAASPQEGHTSA